ncbi:ArsR family transcriptional regulator [Nakamurella silvestris]|nr:ArsR family transcriptional regulator [Nakamurella silvestris]
MSSEEKLEVGTTERSAAVADARTLRALAHPLRAALLDAIRLYGPLTATQAAAQVDDTPSNCSFHLRTLAGAGLIEQAPSDDARSRPWQSVSRQLILEPGPTAESRTSFRAAVDIMHTRSQQGLNTWMDREAEAAQPWRDAWFDTMVNVRMTAAELAAFGEAVNGLLAPYLRDQDRKQPDPTGERQTVRMSLYAHPAPPQDPEAADALFLPDEPDGFTTDPAGESTSALKPPRTEGV